MRLTFYQQQQFQDKPFQNNVVDRVPRETVIFGRTRPAGASFNNILKESNTSSTTYHNFLALLASKSQYSSTAFKLIPGCTLREVCAYHAYTQNRSKQQRLPPTVSSTTSHSETKHTYTVHIPSYNPSIPKLITGATP